MISGHCTHSNKIYMHVLPWISRKENIQYVLLKSVYIGIMLAFLPIRVIANSDIPLCL